MADKKRNIEEFLQTMRDRFAAADAAESEIRAEAEKDLRFVAGDQWAPHVKRKRDAEDRPALVFNHLPTYVAQVSNEARQNKPQIRFGPVDSGADIKTAKVLEGMARAIQYRSSADVAYETAIDYSTSCSFGHFRLLTDYCDDEGFNQEVQFAPILDPFSVYGVLIPRCLGQRPKWAIVLETISKEEFKQRYPDSELVSIGFDDGARIAEGWITQEGVRIAEYWYTETEKHTKTAVGRDGKTLSRVVYKDKIFSCLTNGVEILADTETEWVGKRIPIFTVIGKQMIVGGKPQLFSLVRFMRDPQQLINVYKSGIAENIGLANRVPYIGYKGQFKDPKWRSANVKNYAFLEVEPVSIGGQPAPLPSRQMFEAAIQSLSVAAAQEIDDLKSIAGIFDASLGAQGNETSGIAIQRRKAQSGLTNYHFPDNLTRAQREAGEELGYIIPRVYDTEQEVKIIGENDEESVVTVNTPYTDPETGETHSYMLDAGKYDVTVTTGPGSDTERQEAAELTGKVIQAAPELMGVVGDIFFRNQDNAGADETAERLKRWINLRTPGLIEDDQKKQEIPPQVQQQLTQQGQMLEQLTQQLQVTTEEIKTRKFELDSKERIEYARLELQREELQANILLEHEKMGSKEAMVLLEQRLNILSGEIDAQRATDAQARQHDHEASQAELAAQQQQQLAAQQQQQQPAEETGEMPQAA